MNRLRNCISTLPRTPLCAIVFCLIAHGGASAAAQSPWSAVGPAGGDARAFAAVPGQPSHIYLGTTTSWIYESTDRGASWHRLSKLDSSDDLVLDSMVVDASDPKVLFVGAWKLGLPDGNFYVSHDAGHTWTAVEGLRGQSIRALSQAPSNPRILVAGTLQGVFRSMDTGATWSQISPSGSHEIHEVESIAIDPTDPNIVYAGTWHLPWKTTDGGQNWHSIKQGLIEDSDVFSIILDPIEPRIVFLSACSGIYKSENGGELFKKIQGIPSTARRTRVLMQDPVNRQVVYAGTTEGLYKTLDGGKDFARMTGPDVIVNDVYVDPRDTQHVLLATDRSGVLSSANAGASFADSNRGISERKVEALLVDASNPARIYAGVVNDKSYGGVFVSANGGAAWQQIGGGLEGRDVFALAQAGDGTVLAGTNHGIFGLDTATQSWQPRNTVVNFVSKDTIEMHNKKRVHVEKKVKQPAVELERRVNSIDLSGDAWLAAAGGGLLTSSDKGATWQGGEAMGTGDFLSVAAHGAVMAAAKINGVVLSTDAGQTWMPMHIPANLTRINRLAFSSDGTLWLGAREGVYFTQDQGQKWMWIERLPFRDVDDLYYDARIGKVLASSRNDDQVFAIDPVKLNWNWWRTGYRLSLIRADGSHLLAASLFDGVLVEPRGAGSEIGQR